MNAQFITLEQITALLASSVGTPPRVVQITSTGSNTHTVGASRTGFAIVAVVGQGPGGGGGKPIATNLFGASGGGAGEYGGVLLGRLAANTAIPYFVAAGGAGAAVDGIGSAGAATTISPGGGFPVYAWRSGAPGTSISGTASGGAGAQTCQTATAQDGGLGGAAATGAAGARGNPAGWPSVVTTSVTGGAGGTGSGAGAGGGGGGDSKSGAGGAGGNGGVSPTAGGAGQRGGGGGGGGGNNAGASAPGGAGGPGLLTFYEVDCY